MEFIRKYYKYFICFMILFLCILLFGYKDMDSVWNYGMAYAIRMGEVPYRDFNIITTPLYPFLISFFLLFYNQYITFILAHALLGTVCYYFIDKMVGKKSLLFLPLAGFGMFYLLLPNYNFLVFTFLVILIYLEREEKSDYLIGVVLGLLMLTKHTMGAVIVLFSFLSTFNLSKCYKRLLGMIPLGVVFVFYLLITGSFSSFWDLSVMGLFDFGEYNSFRSPILIGLGILIFLYLLYCLKVNKKDKIVYYLMGSLFFVFPLADFVHFQYVLALFFLFFLESFDEWKHEIKLGVILSILFVFVNIFLNWKVFSISTFSTLPHFKGLILRKEYSEQLNNVFEDYQKRDHVYMFSFTNMMIDIATDHEITYFDIPLYGNFGYHGVSKMKKKVKQMHDVYFYVLDDVNNQYCDELYDYIKEVSNFSYRIPPYEVYYKE